MKTENSIFGNNDIYKGLLFIMANGAIKSNLTVACQKEKKHINIKHDLISKIAQMIFDISGVKITHAINPNAWDHVHVNRRWKKNVNSNQVFFFKIFFLLQTHARLSFFSLGSVCLCLIFYRIEQRTDKLQQNNNS